MALVVLVVFLVAAASPAPAAEPPSPVVTRVEVRSETPVDRAEVSALVAVRPGSPLAEADVQQTVRSLRLSGLAAEVELWTREVAGGVEVIVVLRPDVWVESVEATGETGLDAEALRAAAPQRPGRPLREDRVVRGVYALQDALAAQGYRDAEVRVAVDVDDATRRARIAYQVAAGAQTRVAALRFEGLDGRVSETDAAAALRSSVGEPLRSARVRDDADRLQRFLIGRGYRKASVEPAEELPGAAANTVELHWRVTLGPRVELELVGAERRPLEKRGLLAFLGDAGYDEALVVQSVDQIRAYYQERGHYDVAVRTAERSEGDTLTLRLEIEPGPKWTLEEVDFEGNEVFSDERLARLMKTAPRRLLSPGSGRLVDAELTEDLSNLRSFYALEGFDRVRIGPPRVERREARLALAVPVVEGPKRSVVEVRIEGLTALDAERALRDLPLHAGGPFHRLLVESSAERIRSRLEELGYRAAIVSPEVEWNADQSVARVFLRVLEGERSTAEAILVRGNTRTDTQVLRRFHGLSVGDPISTRAVLDVQRQLYRLGVFSRVDVTVPPVGVEPAAHEVLIEVEEGRTRSAAYGAGYDSESGVRGLLRLSENNLFGRLVTVQFDALVSQRDEAYRALARQPYLGPWTIETRVVAYREAEDRPSFDVSRRGMQIAFERDFGRRRVGLVYDYRLVDLDTEEPESVIPLESREARVASLTPTFFWDRRDDPIDPTRGWSLQALHARAFPAFNADADFAKTFVQATGFVPLGRPGVLALSLRGGAIRPYGEPEDPELDSFDLVPSAERFYAGGRTTHRAFSRDELGVPGDTLFLEPGEDPVPLGGGALALLNAEWRFPIALGFGGSVFVDGGNVWRELGDFQSDEVRWGAGVGVRYLSPVGPLRVEIGWKLDRQEFEDPYVWFISLGNPF